MTANHDLQRRVERYYEAEPALRAPDWVLQSALSTIESTPQRRGLLAPWRFTTMPTFAKLAAAAAVVAVVAFGAWQLFPAPRTGSPTVTTAPLPSPTSVSTAPVPTQRAYVPPALSETFRSDIHGITISYPDGWETQAATEPWANPGPAYFREPFADFLYDPIRRDHLFLEVASKPLEDVSFEDWSGGLMTTLAADGCTGSEPVVVDGADGVIATDCAVALVAAGGRGYLFLLYISGDDADLEVFEWRPWFEQILETAQLRPDSAVDTAPSASP